MNNISSKELSDTFKTLFEFFKHLTTLSSGSILLVLALAEKFVKQPLDAQFLLKAVAFFCVAIITSVVAMGVLAFHAGGDRPSKGAIKLLAWGAAMTGIGFVGGLLFIALTVLRVLG